MTTPGQGHEASSTNKSRPQAGKADQTPPSDAGTTDTAESGSPPREPPASNRPPTRARQVKRIRIDPVVPPPRLKSPPQSTRPTVTTTLGSQPSPPSSGPKAKNRWLPTNRRGRIASIVGLILLLVLLLIVIGANWVSGSTGEPGTDDPPTKKPAADATIPAGAHRLGAEELNKACARIYGAGSTATYIANSGAVPSYWVKCNNNTNQSLGIEEYCVAVYGTKADNPYKFVTDTSKKPWDWWYCQP